MRVRIALVMVALFACEAKADWSPYQNSFLTGEFAVLCANPFRLDDGLQAALADDRAWLKETGCVIAPKGWRVTRISPSSSEETGPWRVRLLSPEGDGFTVWGNYNAFAYPDGSSVPRPRP